jgi:hypothetical protein
MRGSASIGERVGGRPASLGHLVQRIGDLRQQGLRDRRHFEHMGGLKQRCEQRPHEGAAVQVGRDVRDGCASRRLGNRRALRRRHRYREPTVGRLLSHTRQARMPSVRRRDKQRIGGAGPPRQFDAVPHQRRRDLGSQPDQDAPHALGRVVDRHEQSARCRPCR